MSLQMEVQMDDEGKDCLVRRESFFRSNDAKWELGEINLQQDVVDGAWKKWSVALLAQQCQCQQSWCQI